MRLRSLADRAGNLAEHELAARMRRDAMDGNAVFLEAFAGSGMLCNPEAIFRTLLAEPDMSHLRFVWALAGGGHSAARTEFAGNPRVRIVGRRSIAYYRELGRARYLVNNATFPVAFAKRPEQVYLGTWHGTPLKTMGYDMPGGALESANVLRNFLAADYLLAPNAQTASMYLDTYRLRHLWAGRLLETGTPRIDRQFAVESDRLRTLMRLRSDGMHLPDGCRVVLYAPTWRGAFAAPDFDLDRLCADVGAIRRGLQPGSVLLVKVHQRVYAHAAADPRLAGALVGNAIPANDVLAVTDVLVSDYSSVTVDFLASGRPIVRYVPDLQDYLADRGMTIDLAALPGPVCHTAQELTDVLNSDLSGMPATPAYSHARRTFCSLEDGHAAERVIDAVFRNPNHAPTVERGRRSMLIYLGGQGTNGITTSALSLLHKLDYEHLDVTVTFPAPRSADAHRHAELIDPRARVLPRLGRTTWTQVRATPFPFVGGRGRFHGERTRCEQRLRDEWRRCFGDAHFDHVVNFGGYSAFFAKLLRCAPAGTVATWLHNDMYAEMTRSGRSPWLRANVRRTVSMYNTVDALVSVSATLNEVNRRAFAGRVDARLFTFARNTVDAARIRELAAVDVHQRDTGPWVTNGPRTFVTVGRMSEQKNHLRLLNAFAEVRLEYPDTRLLIVGDGPLERELRTAAVQLAISDVVDFTGRIDNPYAVMSGADCFVLSSDYEGQPVVLLEALVLGLPVVTTDFGSVLGALPDGAGLVVRRDVHALAGGMRAFLRGEVPIPTFDDNAYNAQAVAEFYRAVGVPSAGVGALVHSAASHPPVVRSQPAKRMLAT